MRLTDDKIQLKIIEATDARRDTCKRCEHSDIDHESGMWVCDKKKDIALEGLIRNPYAICPDKKPRWKVVKTPDWWANRSTEELMQMSRGEKKASDTKAAPVPLRPRAVVCALYPRTGSSVTMDVLNALGAPLVYEDLRQDRKLREMLQQAVKEKNKRHIAMLEAQIQRREKINRDGLFEIGGSVWTGEGDESIAKVVENRIIKLTGLAVANIDLRDVPMILCVRHPLESAASNRGPREIDRKKPIIPKAQHQQAMRFAEWMVGLTDEELSRIFVMDFRHYMPYARDHQFREIIDHLHLDIDDADRIGEAIALVDEKEIRWRWEELEWDKETANPVRAITVEKLYAAIRGKDIKTLRSILTDHGGGDCKTCDKKKPSKDRKLVVT